MSAVGMSDEIVLVRVSSIQKSTFVVPVTLKPSLIQVELASVATEVVSDADDPAAHSISNAESPSSETNVVRTPTGNDGCILDVEAQKEVVLRHE